MSIKTYLKRGLKFILKGTPTVHISTNVVTFAPNELLKGRVALITGGTSGIGFAIAKEFLKSGANIVITGRNQEHVEEAVHTLQTYGGAYGFVMDNTNIRSFENIFANILTVLSTKGITNIDILVNNAGVNYKGMPNATEDEYDKVLDTNLKGVFFLSQMYGKYLVTNKIKGNILNIASSSSLRPADSAYCVSKWGIRGLTLGLAKSLAPYGITVNGLAPGPTATPMMIKEGQNDMTLKRIPLGRYITPEEIANMATILVCNMGRAVMGDIVYMTGGAGVLTYDDIPYTF